MPGNRRITKKTIKGKESVHPGSRKAGQLTRVHLRTVKLQHAAKNRKEAFSAKQVLSFVILQFVSNTHGPLVQRPLFFLHALTSPLPLSLASLKALTQIYIERNDVRLAELQAERRAGRPKSKEMLELEDRRKAEGKEYDTGIEVPDLTHPHTTRFLYSFIERDVSLNASHVDLLRQVRIFRENDDVVLSKEGKTANMGLGDAAVTELGDDWTRDGEEEAGETVEEAETVMAE